MMSSNLLQLVGILLLFINNIAVDVAPLYTTVKTGALILLTFNSSLQFTVKETKIPLPDHPCEAEPASFPETGGSPSSQTMGQSIEYSTKDLTASNDWSEDDHIYKTMSLHPDFLKLFLKTEDFLIAGSGPLPRATRHYIAIIAAGRHQCRYVIRQHMKEFLAQGGDHKWLNGLDAIPQKLRKLLGINKILAHRPWLLSTEHIKNLTRNDGNHDAWSIGEVVQAMTILAHYHGICSFVGGTGFSEEVTTPFSESPPPSPTIKGSPKSGESPKDVGLDALMIKMKTLEKKQEEFSAEEQLKRYEHVNSLSADLPLTTQVKEVVVNDDLSRFVEEPDFHYVDFAKRGEPSAISTFRVQDFSWDDHGYSLANRFYPNVADFLDDIFKLAFTMTYHTLGQRRNVDTTLFRRAIWNYIQCMFGIRWDDYDYGEVNQLLERSLKTYVKTVVCFPERVSKKDFQTVLREFKTSERIHINLMMLEARIQAELLYALRAVSVYMR